MPSSDSLQLSGRLRKMTHEPAEPIRYFLSLDGQPHPLNPHLGKRVRLGFQGVITCVECGRKIRKTYDEGYCYPCFRDLPETDLCAVRPERCEHDRGDEKAQAFYRTHCRVDHFVYLSLTAGVKVGVTRHWNLPSRWIDQGAVQGLVIARTPERRLAGALEVALARHMADKTNWRKMLKGEVEAVDLTEWRQRALAWVPENLRQYWMEDQAVQVLHYPVQALPEKIVSHNLDKEPAFTDRLTGIKGQYLIFEHRVINLRKYAGYHIRFEFSG